MIMHNILCSGCDCFPPGLLIICVSEGASRDFGNPSVWNHVRVCVGREIVGSLYVSFGIKIKKGITK